MYNPFDGDYRLTSDWEDHLARGSEGGHDYAMAVGTILPALFTGRVERYSSASGGISLRLVKLNGDGVRYLHLSKYIAPEGALVMQGRAIAYSGNSGSATTGPHLHIHGIKNGIRVPYFDVLESLPVPPQVESEDEMKPVIFRRINSGGAEWSLMAPWIVGGYIITTDPAKGLAWERMYARGSGTANNVDRAGYIAAQDVARTIREEWVRGGS